MQFNRGNVNKTRRNISEETGNANKSQRHSTYSNKEQVTKTQFNIFYHHDQDNSNGHIYMSQRHFNFFLTYSDGQFQLIRPREIYQSIWQEEGRPVKGRKASERQEEQKGYAGEIASGRKGRSN